MTIISPHFEHGLHDVDAFLMPTYIHLCGIWPSCSRYAKIDFNKVAYNFIIFFYHVWKLDFNLV